MLYQRFPGALPSELAKEDVGELTRPFQAGRIFSLMLAANGGNEDSLSKADRQLVEPLIKEVRKLARRNEAAKRLNRGKK